MFLKLKFIESPKFLQPFSMTKCEQFFIPRTIDKTTKIKNKIKTPLSFVRHLTPKNKHAKTKKTQNKKIKIWLLKNNWKITYFKPENIADAIIKTLKNTRNFFKQIILKFVFFEKI